ncbi:MAG: hypothetical protein CVU85_00330 [Firmicutes bacterium HGW-Firmicutes-10]|nr:MAG: hypothetical protein CVU85_00330 [Firmicutes bacterium HGW-Firmicutes-10]
MKIIKIDGWMVIMKFRLLTIKEYATYTVLVLYILFVTDSMIFGLNSNSTIVSYAKISIFVFLMLLLIYSFIINIKLNIKEIMVALIFVISLLISMIFTKDFTGAYFFKIALVIISLISAKLLNINKFIEAYINVMIFIAIFSLFAMLLQESIIQLDLFPEITTPKGYVFTSLGLTNIPHYNSYKIRNWGPFWEPGVFQAYLNFALFFVIYWSKNNEKKGFFRVIFISFAILSTLSTAGIIAMTLMLTSLVIKKDNNPKNIRKIALLLLFALVSVYVLNNPHLSTMIFGKLFVHFEGNNTLMSRWYSITGILKIYSSSLIFGVGPNNVLLELASYANRAISATNTITFHFASFGLFSGLIYIWYTYKNVILSSKKAFATIMLIAWLSVILMSQNFTYSLFFNIFMFMSFSDKNKAKGTYNG